VSGPWAAYALVTDMSVGLGRAASGCRDEGNFTNATYDSRRAQSDPHGCLLLPSLLVQADHEEPQGEHTFPARLKNAASKESSGGSHVCQSGS